VTSLPSKKASSDHESSCAPCHACSAKFPCSRIHADRTTGARCDRLAEQLRFWRRSISKHKWSALALALAIALLTTLIVFVIQPTYRSTATLMLESNKSKVVGIEEVYSAMSSNREYYQTQAEILKSEELARRIVTKMKLVDHPVMDPRKQQESGFSLKKLVPAAWLGEDDADKFTPEKSCRQRLLRDSKRAHDRTGPKQPVDQESVTKVRTRNSPPMPPTGLPKASLKPIWMPALP
jgi:hypothetical protein